MFDTIYSASPVKNTAALATVLKGNPKSRIQSKGKIPVAVITRKANGTVSEMLSYTK